MKKKKEKNLHDLLFREVYSKKKYAMDLFRLVLKKEEYACFNWTQLKAELTNFVDEEHREKRADLVFSAPLKGSTRIVKIVFLLEHKSYQDKKLLLQLLHYQNYLYTKFPHTAVLPIVIYHGKEKKWKLPKDFQAYISQHYPRKLSKLLKKNMLNFPYKLLNIQSLEEKREASLTTSPILFILKSVWSLNKKVVKEFFTRSRKLEKEDKYFLVEAATYYIGKNDRSFNRQVLEKLERTAIRKGEKAMSLIKMAREEAKAEARQEGIEKGIEKGMEKGIEKGMEKGMEKGKVEEKEEIALRMLEKEVEIENICAFTDLSEERVLELKKKNCR